MKNRIILLILMFIGFWFFFTIFQNTWVYNHSLKFITKNWIEVNNERKLEFKPYEKLTNENYIRWDGVHYQFIKDNGYDTRKAGGDYIFAFFPLFSLIWKATFLPPVGVIFLNFLLFAFGLLLLLKLFGGDCIGLFQAAIVFPGLVCFLLPYSEAVFFLFISIGLFGYINKKYWIYFSGFLLAAMTRPAAIILVLSFLFVELYCLLRNRNILNFLKSFLRNTIPIILGTFLIALYQINYGSNSLFKFAEVQSLWGKKFGFPHQIIDWSHESFSMDIATLVFVFIPLILLLLLYIFNIRSSKSVSHVKPIEYLKLLSATYIVGSTFYILLFQNGSLNGLYRYTLCTPFFFFLFYNQAIDLKNVSIIKRVGAFIILFSLGLICFLCIPYSGGWNYSDYGFIGFSIMFLFWMFQFDFKTTHRIILYIFIFISNLIWTSFLFNTYISNGWIFT